MKRDETNITPETDNKSDAGDESAVSAVSVKESHVAQFIGVYNTRKRRIPGLYIRNGRYYGSLWAENNEGKKVSRRFPLLDDDGNPVETITDAKDAFDVLKSNRKEKKLPASGHKPNFDVFSDAYLELASTKQKGKGTQENEHQKMTLWKAHLGGIRIDRIKLPLINSLVEKRLAGCRLDGKSYAPASKRTVKLDLIALRAVLKAAKSAGHLRELPEFPIVIPGKPPMRSLIVPAQFDLLLSTCLSLRPDGKPLVKYGEQLRDLLRLLAYGGGREQETLRIKWAHVDFEERKLFIGALPDFVAAAITIGTGGNSKNKRARCIEFNQQLEDLLLEMRARRAPDSSWVFPSPQRGAKDIRAMTLRGTFLIVREAAGLPDVGFHDMRHLFISYCVMAGIDFMTIAEWVGHKDGGVLIGNVYGHLLNSHRQKMAGKAVFGLVSSPPAAAD